MKMCAAPNCSYPVFGKGFCKKHQYMRADFDRRSPMQKYQDNVREGKVEKAGYDGSKQNYITEDEPLQWKKNSIKNTTDLQRWFEDRRKEMKGRCVNCGGTTLKPDDEKFNDKYYKHFAAHILPKAYFPSIATHPANWIELCFFGHSCHTNMDNKILDLTEMNCWDLIVTRFQEMYPMIDKKERRRIPAVLLQYINIDI